MLKTVTLSVLLSLVSIGLVLYFVGSPGDLQGLLFIPRRVLFLSVGLMLLNYLVGGLRLALLVRLMGQRLPLYRGVRAYLLGLFSAAVTPGGSGHAPAIVLSLKRDGVRSSLGWSISIYTGVLDILFFAWSVPLALVVLASARGFTGLANLVYLALPFGLLLLGLWYLLAYRLDLLSRFAFRLFSLASLRRYRRSVLRGLVKLRVATDTMTGGSYASHALLQVLTVVLHLSNHAIFYALARGLGADVQLLPTLSALLLAAVVGNVVPTPGASGYTELAVSYLFSQRADLSFVAPAVLGWRLLTHYSNFIVGPILGGTMLAKSILASNKQ